MNNIKILKKIEPFNEVFYKSCFYNSLFPIINHFDKEVMSVLINDVPVYSNFEEKNDLCLEMSYLNQDTLLDNLNSLGIEFKSSEFKENLIDSIINSISNNSPVIIYIDSFYEPFRKDSYLKKHIIHTLLVYGYDNTQKTMNIIEHNHRDNLTYKKRTINYMDIQNSYYGFQQNFDLSNKIHSYYEFQLMEEKECLEKRGFSKESHNSIYFKNFKIRENEVFNGLKKLKKFNENLTKVIQDESLLNQVLDQLINSLNTIINVKQVETYKIADILEEESCLIKMQQQCLEHWKAIRVIVAKYKFTKIYNTKKIMSITNKLEEIYNVEYSYFKHITMNSSGKDRIED